MVKREMLTVLACSRAETVREVQGARALLLAEGGVANFLIGEETPSIAGRPRQRHERVQVAEAGRAGEQDSHD